MKYVTEVGKVVGVSCGGEDRKLSNVFGGIISDNTAKGEEVEPRTERYERA
jgi:hypothetical protein